MDVSLIYGDYYFIEALIRLNEANLTLALVPPVPALLCTAKRIEPSAAKSKGLRLGRETIVIPCAPPRGTLGSS